MTNPAPTHFDYFDYDRFIPAATMEALDAYIRYGQHPGGFLEAVLTNDLYRAVERADDRNKPAIVSLVLYLYNKVPSGAHGSYERFASWRNDGGLTGREARSAGVEARRFDG